MYTQHPLIHRELYLSGEIMDVFDESTENFSLSRTGFGANSFNAVGGEVGIESGGAVGRHSYGLMRLFAEE